MSIALSTKTIESPWAPMSKSILEDLTAAALPLLTGRRVSLPVGEEGEFIEVALYEDTWCVISHGQKTDRVTGSVGGSCMSKTELCRLIRLFVEDRVRAPQLTLF